MSEHAVAATEPRRPAVTHLTVWDLRSVEGLGWDGMKELLIAKGIPPERLEGKPDFRADDMGADGLMVEFP